MTYNGAMFGKALKELVLKKEDVTVIGEWAFTIYWKHLQDIDDNELDELLLHLTTMESGPEFAISYEQLNEIADDLIAGINVSWINKKLNDIPVFPSECWPDDSKFQRYEMVRILQPDAGFPPGKLGRIEGREQSPLTHGWSYSVLVYGENTVVVVPEEQLESVKRKFDMDDNVEIIQSNDPALLGKKGAIFGVDQDSHTGKWIYSMCCDETDEYIEEIAEETLQATE